MVVRWHLCTLLIGLALGMHHAVVVAEPPAGSKKRTPKFDATSLEFFEREVRPLLVKRCYSCHSAKAKELQAELRLDSRAGVLQGGETGPAVVPGDAKKSLLVDAINYGEIYQMPPKTKLPKNEIAILTKWVELGVPWPDGGGAAAIVQSKFDLEQRRASHWCWQPIKNHELPAVKNKSWPQQPLDYFILAKLEEKGLTPAARANRRTLIRRAYFDAIGLPPKPAEVEAFVNDTSPKAFEKVVDHLLKSPHFGERWARHWMDLVRYAESYGHEFDYNIPHPTAYRDYLIRAFNADVPYDQFVKEHIAGDLLPNPRRHPTDGYNESIIGTGFWYLGEATHAPVDVRGDEAGRIDNQIDVMSKTFLGLTVACARCHDHKFDAISTKDYYSLGSFLKSSRRQEAFLDPHGKITEATQKIGEHRAAADTSLRNALPDVDDATRKFLENHLQAVRELLSDPSKPTVEAVAEKRGLKPEILTRWRDAFNDQQIKDKTHALRPWLEIARQQREVAASDIVAARQQLEAEANRVAQAEKQAPLFADFSSGTYDGWFTTGWAFGDAPTKSGKWDSLRRGVRGVQAGIAHSGMQSKGLRGVLRSPTFTISHKKIFYKIAAENVQIRLIIDGYFMDVYNALLFRGCNQNVNTKGNFTWHQQGGDPGRYVGHRAHIEIIDHGDGYAALDEIRFGDGGPPPPRPSELSRQVLADARIKSFDQLTAAYSARWSDAIADWKRGEADESETALVNWAIERQLLPMSETLAAKLGETAKSIDELSKGLPNPQRVLGITDGTGENGKVYIRGNPRTLGEEAPRRMLTAVRTAKTTTSLSGSGRLQLADEIVASSNPLTSRVIANRLWHHLFGRGIVPSVDNFGVLGQKPTHPKLLDAMALQFVRDGWSVKKFIRSIMLSSTYQMASTPSEQGDKVDPSNQLLHRMRIRRLQGEAIRDSMLMISGRLDPKMFAGSVPVHLTPFMQGRGRPRGGPLDGAGRRSIYTAVRRNFLPPMMLAFDTPIPFNTVGRRNVSNVPAQALIMMNDPLVVQQAQVWAKRLLAQSELTARQRVEQMYLIAFARPPSDDELTEAIGFLEQQGEELGLATDAAQTDPRVWSDLCHVIMNVKEFIFLN